MLAALYPTAHDVGALSCDEADGHEIVIDIGLQGCGRRLLLEEEVIELALLANDGEAFFFVKRTKERVLRITTDVSIRKAVLVASATILLYKVIIARTGGRLVAKEALGIPRKARCAPMQGCLARISIGLIAIQKDALSAFSRYFELHAEFIDDDPFCWYHVHMPFVVLKLDVKADLTRKGDGASYSIGR
ncbi:hypothetical protein HMPREF3192_00004 [Atopobium deltae]|uniref:Uncharacterized protein n=1 Tax=Atopobium deltae TaxID=1393034 RepID=A0A133XXD0_9ACTN|nr:hypothetical protein HMPREF3192_00004 [Atopobium deltae]